MEMTAYQLIKLYMPSRIITGNIYYAPTPEEENNKQQAGDTNNDKISKIKS